MLSVRWALIALALATGVAGFPSRAQQLFAQTPGAVAEIADAKGTRLGRATFSSLPEGVVWIEVNVAGVSPGVHGIHIHENGVCQGPEFATAGGHFNPRGRVHGMAHLEGAHAGDLPNMVVNESGKARYEAANVRITMGEGPNSLFKPGGTSLVITRDPDDQLTDPEGNSGPRIACGVIRRSR